MGKGGEGGGGGKQKYQGSNLGPEASAFADHATGHAQDLLYNDHDCDVSK